MDTDSKTCPICFQELESELRFAQVEGCNHEFCTTCIRKWSQEKTTPTCPCCNREFNFIFEVKKDGSKVKLDAKSLVKASRVKNRDRDELETTTGNGVVISDMHWELSQRRGLYRNNMRVKQLRNASGRHRPIQAGWYRQHPGYLHRLFPFIRRELQAVVPGLPFTELQAVESRIYQDCQFTGLPKPGRCEYLVAAFNGNRQYAAIFCHELLNFAASPFETVQEYDQNAIYATLEDGQIAALDERSNQTEVIDLDSSRHNTSTAQPATSQTSSTRQRRQHRSTTVNNDDDVCFVRQVVPPTIVLSSDDSESDSDPDIQVQDGVQVLNDTSEEDGFAADTGFFGNLGTAMNALNPYR